MKALIILAMSFCAVYSFAGVLTPVSGTEQQVNVSQVEGVEFFKSSDEVVSGSVTTVFRGSAMGFSSAFLTFADSLEDTSFTFEFAYIVGKPQSISVLKARDGSYTFEMDVKKVKNTGADFEYVVETIVLSVRKVNGEYLVEQP